ncbi:TPA: hypothetical protein ACH3X1_008886 [Trebouxia sp. C0004]
MHLLAQDALPSPVPDLVSSLSGLVAASPMAAGNLGGPESMCRGIGGQEEGLLAGLQPDHPARPCRQQEATHAQGSYQVNRLNVLREGFISLRLHLQEAKKSTDIAHVGPGSSSAVPRALPSLLARAPPLLDQAKKDPPASVRHIPLIKSVSSSDYTTSAATSFGQTLIAQVCIRQAVQRHQGLLWLNRHTMHRSLASAVA